MSNKRRIQNIGLMNEKTAGLEGRIFEFDTRGICVIENDEDVKFFLSIPGFKLIEKDTDISEVKDKNKDIKKPRGEHPVLEKPLENDEERSDFSKQRIDIEKNSKKEKKMKTEGIKEDKDKKSEDFDKIMDSKKVKKKKKK